MERGIYIIPLDYFCRIVPTPYNGRLVMKLLTVAFNGYVEPQIGVAATVGE